MRWVLAAASFALLVSLAVTTTAVRATSLDLRARLERIEFGLMTHQMEIARRDRKVREETELPLLVRRWQELSRHRQERMAEELQ